MRKNIGVFLSLRLKQALRELQATGGLGILLAGFLALGALYWYSQKLEESLFYCLLPALLLSSLHFSRSDHRFLLLYFQRFKWQILVMEYVFVSAPFAAITFFFSQLWALGLLVVAALLPFLPPLPAFQTQFHIPGIQWLPNGFFEWKSAIRRNPLIWLAVLVLPFLVVLHPAFPILTWVLELLLLTSLYKECEDWSMLTLGYRSPSTLIFRKFILHFRSILIINVPSLVLFSILYSDYYWVSLVFVVLLAFNLFYSLVCKYAFYQPNRVQSPNQIWIGIGLISLLFPPFLPLPFVMAIRFYQKSISTLQIYFDA